MFSALVRPFPFHLEKYVVREENLKIAEKQFVRACEDREEGRQPCSPWKGFLHFRCKANE